MFPTSCERLRPPQVKQIQHCSGFFLLLMLMLSTISTQAEDADTIPPIRTGASRHTIVETPAFHLPATGGMPSFHFPSPLLSRVKTDTPPHKGDRAESTESDASVPPSEAPSATAPRPVPPNQATPGSQAIAVPAPESTGSSRERHNEPKVSPRKTVPSSLTQRFLRHFQRIAPPRKPKGLSKKASNPEPVRSSRRPLTQQHTATNLDASSSARLDASSSARLDASSSAQLEAAQLEAAQLDVLPPLGPLTVARAAPNDGRLSAFQLPATVQNDVTKRNQSTATPPTAANDTQPSDSPSVEEIKAPAATSTVPEPTPLLDHKPIADLTLQINRGESSDEQPLEFPPNLAASYFANQQTVYADTEFMVAHHHPHLESLVDDLNAAHMPVYFEEEQLERYGTGKPLLQPALSGAHFFGNVVSLPYKMVVEPPRRTRYYTYPFAAGRAAPKYLRPYPLKLDATAAEMAVIIGLIALIP